MYVCMYTYVNTCIHMYVFSYSAVYCTSSSYICMMYTSIYVCIYAYQDKPMVEITNVTGGCGYVYVLWIVLGNNDMCEITNFHLTLVSLVMGLPEGTTTQKSTNMNSYNFTGLPDDTEFRITIIGSSLLLNTDPASTSVRTKSMYSMYTYVQYVHICTVTMHACFTHTLLLACSLQHAYLIM